MAIEYEAQQQSASDRARDAILVLMSTRKMKRTHLARAMGQPYHWVQERLNEGEKQRSDISLNDADRFARFFGVPLGVLVEGSEAVFAHLADLNRSLCSVALPEGQMEMHFPPPVEPLRVAS